MSEKLNQIDFDKNRANKLRYDFKFSIQNKINNQINQAITYLNLLTQTQKIENIDAAKQKTRDFYKNDLLKQNRNQNE